MTTLQGSCYHHGVGRIKGSCLISVFLSGLNCRLHKCILLYLHLGCHNRPAPVLQPIYAYSLYNHLYQLEYYNNYHITTYYPSLHSYLEESILSPPSCLPVVRKGLAIPIVKVSLPMASAMANPMVVSLVEKRHHHK